MTPIDVIEALVIVRRYNARVTFDPRSVMVERWTSSPTPDEKGRYPCFWETVAKEDTFVRAVKAAVAACGWERMKR